ncbi:MAG: penicillin acylase family protein, partial [Acidimicrobiales bacterium]
MPPRRVLPLLLVPLTLATWGGSPAGSRPAVGIDWPAPHASDTARWRALAAAVTIYRDRYGIPHVFGATDAAAVFGFAYAQAEDNFPRIEENFLRATGRAAEAYGPSRLDGDRVARALELPRLAREEYGRLDRRTRALVDAYADGVNFFLFTRPALHPRLLTRIEPWHPLAFVRYNYYQNGFLYSAGFDPRELRTAGLEAPPRDDVGSNGWVVRPSRSASGHALLFINPHLPFFGPGQVYEGHVHSEEGWDFTGYTRFGFPFPYVGHNASLGWVSTDNSADQADLYLERFDDPARPLAYRYGDGSRLAVEWSDTIRVRTDSGVEARPFTFRKTHHGPIIGYRDGRPLAVRMAKLDADGWLAEWYAMTRARSVAELRRAMRPLAMLFGNVMAADRDGRTWYLYNGAVPRRDPRFDWTSPVDGSDPATEWQGYHPIDELPELADPSSGWMHNCNSSPFQLTDRGNPDSTRFPRYMVSESGNPRAQASERLLAGTAQFTFEAWAQAAFDTHVITADSALAPLFAAAASRADSALLARTGPAVEALRGWNGVSDTASVAMTLFVAWRQLGQGRARRGEATGGLAVLAEAMDTLAGRFGT